MNNYKERPLSKYVPNSPTSPHMYHEDSFEAEELSRSLPHAPIPPHNYELTFKKQAQQQFFTKEPQGLAPRSLFAPSEQTLLDHIRLPLAEYHRKSLEELSCLPFADLMSVEMPEMLREKVGLIGEIVEVKRMRLKASSVAVNLRCLKVREALTHEDKHRLFLLELLWKQLSKKTFLEALKLNLAQNKYLRLFGSKEQEMHEQTQQEESHRIKGDFMQGDYYEEDYSRQHSHLWQKEEEQEEEQGEDGSDSENWQEKLMVFSHSIMPIFQKQLFFAFTRISQTSLRPHNNPKSTFEHEYQSIPLISRPNITDSQEPPQQQQEQEGEVEHEISESKLQQLYFYIEELHEQCAESENLLKRYFIKLKINLLESIAQSMLNQIRANSMNPPPQEEQAQPESEQSFQQDRIQEQGGVEDSRESRLTSELSQDGSLKSEKRLLKEYLRETRVQSFFSCLREHWEARKIQSICLEMRKGGILHKAFRALAENAKDAKFERQMDGYYEEVANDQCEDDGASKFFHKTNLLYRYFQRLKENHRNEIILRLLNSTTLKLAFRTIKSHGLFEQRQRNLVERHRLKAQNRLVFKYFSSWKQVYLSENCLNDRFRLHVSMRERQTLQHYFSVLKLHFKRALLRERRTDQHYQRKLRAKVFLCLKCLYEDSKEFSERSYALQEYLRYTRGSCFLRQLRSFCADYTAYQRFSVKEVKLQRMLIRLHALQGIKQWRQAQLRKQAYQAIEMKLLRYKNKQRKRHIFARWLERTQQVLYRSGGSPSEQHKDWLVKYYSNLCSVLPS